MMSMNKWTMKLDFTFLLNKLYFQSWRKFGDCKNDKPGPDTSTTIIGDDVFLNLMTGKEVCLYL